MEIFGQLPLEIQDMCTSVECFLCHVKLTSKKFGVDHYGDRNHKKKLLAFADVTKIKELREKYGVVDVVGPDQQNLEDQLQVERASPEQALENDELRDRLKNN